MTASADRVKSIFLHAIETASADERVEYLDAICAGDGELRRQVEELLLHHADLGAFLESPHETITQPRGAEQPGAVIGPYKLLEQIGEGGFGIVFMAEQQRPVRRRVALKVIKPGMDTRQIVARFEAERQALALMDHPNIAHVFDGGETSSGRPYFVMELVRGVPITDFSDQTQQTIRERLGLFVIICRAVQHAHQKGIIHRDLKPSNILVTLHDDTPVVKVIDFGVAKAMGQQLTEKTLFTNFVQMIGTPLYMSPEQAQMSGLDADTRSDIYSLGVLLYELLTGTTPFDKERLRTAAYDEIRRIIREEEPIRPSRRLSTLGTTVTEVSDRRKTDPTSLSRQCRGELDWIVLKALEKNRNRRYETASALAADVERYLHDEPVLACPPSAGYRLRKFARRNRGPVLVASIVLLALVGGIVGAMWGLMRATEARIEARQSERARSEQLWESLIAQARAISRTHRPGQRFESLAALRRATLLAQSLNMPTEKFHELRNGAIAALALPDLHLGAPWNPCPADTYGVDFDESMTKYVRTNRRGDSTIRRITDDQELFHLPGLGTRAVPHFDGSGRFLAVTHYGKEPALTGVVAEIWDLGDFEHEARRVLSEQNARQIAFERARPYACVAYNDGAIRRFELTDGLALGPPLVPNTLTKEVTIAPHPSEPIVAVCSYFGQVVQIRNITTGEIVASLPQPEGASHVAWHPDGQTLAVSPGNAGLTKLVDRSTFQTYRMLPAMVGGTILTFNHAGDRLVGYGWGSAVELFDVGTGQKLFETISGGSRRFSQDDRQMAGGIRDGRLGIWQVGDQREYHILNRRDSPNATYESAVAVHAQGRLLAAGCGDGFGLWDLVSGSELAFVSMRDSGAPIYDVRFDASGGLLTAGASGLLRWPIRGESKSPEQLTIGTPERLLPRASSIGQSADGRVTVAGNRAVGPFEEFAGGWVLHADGSRAPIRLDAGADIGSIAISPDGQWVVTATHNVGQAKVWDAHTGRLVHQLCEWGAGNPQFSPDGRWITTACGGGCLYEVDTWKTGPRILAHALAPDGKMGAVQTPAGPIQLIDMATGEQMATLESPASDWKGAPVFTPDGATLIAPANGKAKGLHVWDLRLIRKHLLDLGLDWDALPYPSAREPNDLSRRLTVKVVSGDTSEAAPNGESNKASATKKD